MVLLLARHRSCSRYPKAANREWVDIYDVCMKFDIYYLKETNNILKWEEIGMYGKRFFYDEGTIFFPKIIRKRKNDIFPFWPELYLGYPEYDHQNGSQVLFENWTKNMTRDIDDNFPMTVTNRMSRLRILQI